MKRSRPRAEDYTIGWISALPLELSAAQLVLDEEHESVAEFAQYTLGRIGSHNVVQACLPAGQYGTNSAAVTAAEVRSKFPNILYWLMVGIGGGVPGPNVDIRLGDVVVCKPQNQHGGVVQYDLGKIGPNGKHIRTGLLNAPPMVLGAAVSKTQSIHDIGKSKVQSYLSAFSHLRQFQRGSLDSDILFESDYHHDDRPSCAQCLPGRIVTRSRRPDENVVVHFGLIASGNQVIKDGVTRDTLSAELGGVLCFEMEAAGLINNFPCLVIRGVCDYADSHKSKNWQYFAAASAAACAKEVLSCIPCSPCWQEDSAFSLRSKPLSEHTSHQESRADNVPVKAQEILTSRVGLTGDSKFVSSPLTNDQRKGYLDSLRFSNINARHATIRTAHSKTCRWILSRASYLDWLNDQYLEQHHGFLWIKGKPGAGKSTLMKFILSNTLKRLSASLVLSFFFHARGDALEKSTLGMYQSILYQLLEKVPELQDVLGLWPPQQDEEGVFSWQIGNLKVAFEHAISQLQDRSVIMFIDALDECDEREIRDMVSFFEYLGDIAVTNGIKFRVCFSSRHYPHVTIERCIELVLEEAVEHGQDIEQYLRTDLKIGQSKFANDIRSEILQRASGIFLWVVLVAKILNEELSKGNKHTMKKRLQEIPDGLERLFEDMLTRDNHNTDQLVLCLQWVLFSQEDLKIEGLYSAILSATDPSAVVPWKLDEIDPDDMRKFVVNNSKGLVEETKTKNKRVQFIHESVRDYFLKGDRFNTTLFGPFETFEARSHDVLKLCCFNYYTEVASIKRAFVRKIQTTGQAQNSKATKAEVKSLFNHDVLAYAFASDHTREIRKSFNREDGYARLPFIEYAVQYVWYHCDKSHGLGIPQDSFIQTFSRADWLPLRNAVEKYEKHLLSEGVNSLYVFAKEGLSSLVERELSQVADIDQKGEAHGFPLLAAARGAKSEVTTKILLRHHLRDRSDVSDQEVDRIVALLLKNSTPVLQSDKSMLHWAARVPDIGLWKAFFPDGTLDDSIVESCGNRLLAHACEFGFADKARQLLESGVHPNATAANGRTALSLASQNNHLEIVRLLLEYRADVNWSGTASGQMSPLVAASAAGHISIVELLLVNNADCDLWDGKSRPVNTAASMGDYEILKLFFEQADRNSPQEYNRISCALGHAAMSGQMQTVQYILARVTDVNDLDRLCRANLWSAVGSPETHRVELVELLLSHILDTGSFIGVEEYFAIYYAASAPLVLKMLLERGLNIDSLSEKGQTSLFYCAWSGAYESVSTLLHWDADVTISDRKGMTPLQGARKRGYTGITKLIEDHINRIRPNTDGTDDTLATPGRTHHPDPSTLDRST